MRMDLCVHRQQEIDYFYVGFSPVRLALCLNKQTSYIKLQKSWQIQCNSETAKQHSSSAENQLTCGTQQC